MINSLKQKLSTNVLAFRVALLLFPMLLLICGTRWNFARRVYSAYTMLPPSLIPQGARAAHRTSRVLRKQPLEAALHSAVAYRLDFDSGSYLNKWASRVDELLTQCDVALDNDGVTELLLETLSVLFHPNVHQGLVPSPFVESPELLHHLLSHPSLVRLRSSPASTRSQSFRNSAQPTRTLVLTDTNFAFMGSVLDHWQKDPSVELRARNLQAEGVNRGWWGARNTVVDRLRGTAPEVPEFLREDIEWADVVYVEWSEALAARLSGVSMAARLVVRLHRYEAFTQTPTLTNWDNVDTVVIITPYMHELLTRTLPGIEERTSIQFSPNVVDLRSFERPKNETADKSIALIQWGSIVKDPIWALDVLRMLHKHDPEWRLLLIGSDGRSEFLDKSIKCYLDEFDREAATFGDSVQRLGYRSDLAEVMREAGFVLSSSRVEGAPVSLQEAIASGSLPVVRDWPTVRAINGARSLYPADWVVDSPAEAANRILDWAQTDKSSDGGQDPKAWIIQHYDASVTLAQLDRVVFER